MEDKADTFKVFSVLHVHSKLFVTHMKVTIVSPEKTLYDDQVEGIKLPGTKGRFEVLKGHAPIISTLTNGTVECLGENPFKVNISGGFVEVANDAVSVCVEM